MKYLLVLTASLVLVCRVTLASSQQTDELQQQTDNSGQNGERMLQNSGKPMNLVDLKRRLNLETEEVSSTSKGNTTTSVPVGAQSCGSSEAGCTCFGCVGCSACSSCYAGYDDRFGQATCSDPNGRLTCNNCMACSACNHCN